MRNKHTVILSCLLAFTLGYLFGVSRPYKPDPSASESKSEALATIVSAQTECLMFMADQVNRVELLLKNKTDHETQLRRDVKYEIQAQIQRLKKNC
jgi:hypothetical protein